MRLVRVLAGLGIVAFSVAVAFTASAKLSDKQLSDIISKAPSPAVGRWQIIHGAPTQLYSDFLLDTMTGVSYVRCKLGSGDDFASGWCLMPRDQPLDMRAQP